MNEIETTWKVIAGVLTAYILIMNAIEKWNKPRLEEKEREKRIDNKLIQYDDHLSKIDKQIEKLTTLNEASSRIDSIIARALLLMIDHDIHGNNIEGLKALKEELERSFL